MSSTEESVGVSVTYDYRMTDHLRAVLGLARDVTPSRAVVVTAFICVGVLTTSLTLAGLSLMATAMVLLSGLALLYVATIGFSVWMARSVPGGLGRHRVTITAAGVTDETEEIRQALAWTTISEITDSGRAVMLRVARSAVIVIPHRAFGDAEEAAAFLATARRLHAAAGALVEEPQPVAVASEHTATAPPPPQPVAAAPYVAAIPPPPPGSGPDATAPSAPARRVPWGVVTALLTTVLVVGGDWWLYGLSFELGTGIADLYLAVGSLAVIVAGAWVAARVHGREAPRRILGWRRPRWADVGVGVLGAIVILGFDQLLSVAVDLFWPVADGNAQEWIDASLVAAPLATGIAVGLTGPVAEEVLFRGLLYQGLRTRMRLVWALLASTAIFAILHPTDLSPSSIALLISVGVAGVVFAGLFEWRGTLVAPVVAHVIVNGLATGLGLLAAGTWWVVAVGEDQPVRAFDLPVGTCATGYPDEDSGAWTEGAAVDCAVPHDLEVYEIWDLGDREAPYPGHDALSAAADEHCLERFEAFVGIAWDDSALDYLATVPSEEAWADGDRAARCLLIDYEREPLTGGKAGSRE